MPEINSNPFNKQETARAYAETDPVYASSARAIMQFVAPSGLRVADLGAGTGVSSEIIYQALNRINPQASLSLIEPSAHMLNEARIRLGSACKYIQAVAEELEPDSFDCIYALNCFHLFPDHSKALEAISGALSKEGIFVFNLSSPSFKFNHLEKAELEGIYSNLDFYAELHLACPNPILASTVALLAHLASVFSGIESQAPSHLSIYDREQLEKIFKTAKMELDGYTELVIRVPAEYQRNIWRMMAKSFLDEESQIETIISAIELPELIPIRQAVFKLCKVSN